VNSHPLAPGRGTTNRIQPPGPDRALAGRPSRGQGGAIPVQSSQFVDPHFPFQPLPKPNGLPPYRFDLGALMTGAAVDQITASGKLVFHIIGDTGDDRGKQMDFVAAMMTEDYDQCTGPDVPAFCYHLGDIVYFAGDIDLYGTCFYETYSEYPAPIVSIPGNHDGQPDDPQDGPVDPSKTSLDGWVQNFMSNNPAQLGSLKTNSARTQMDLPNVYWTFTTPFATIIGLYSNASETEAAFDDDQIGWFRQELSAADPQKALIVAVHHPPFSGDVEHSGSNVAEQVLFAAFSATGIYPHLILSGHVHNYQRFTVSEPVGGQQYQIPCVISGNGGYTRLGTLYKVNGSYPTTPFQVTDVLTLESYDQSNFGFVRLEVSEAQIKGVYYGAPYSVGATPSLDQTDGFVIDLKARTVK
jgi:hypothetical protein